MHAPLGPVPLLQLLFPPPLALLACFLSTQALWEGLSKGGEAGALPLNGTHSRTEAQDVESHAWFQAVLLCDSQQAASLSEPISRLTEVAKILWLLRIEQELMGGAQPRASRHAPCPRVWNAL